MGLFKGKDEKSLELFEGVYYTEVDSFLKHDVDGKINARNVLDAHERGLSRGAQHVKQRYNLGVDTSYFYNTLLAITATKYGIPMADLLAKKADPWGDDDDDDDWI